MSPSVNMMIEPRRIRVRDNPFIFIINSANNNNIDNNNIIFEPFEIFGIL